LSRLDDLVLYDALRNIPKIVNYNIARTSSVAANIESSQVATYYLASNEVKLLSHRQKVDLIAMKVVETVVKVVFINEFVFIKVNFSFRFI